MKYTVALDCDGVLFDFVSAFLVAFNQELGRNALPPDWMPETWDIARDPQVRAASVGVYGRIADWVYGKRALPKLIQPYSHAADLLAQLHALDVRIVFATSPMSSNAEWCYHREHACEDLCRAAGIPSAPVVFTHDKTLVNANLLVDDRAEHVRAFNELPGRIGLLFDQPYNRAESVPFRTGSRGLVAFVTEQVARRR